jgi:hypothetical protein
MPASCRSVKSLSRGAEHRVSLNGLAAHAEPYSRRLVLEELLAFPQPVQRLAGGSPHQGDED